MRQPLTLTCVIITLLAITEPSVQKSVESGPRQDTFARPQARIKRKASDALLYPADETTPSDQMLLRGGLGAADMPPPSPCHNDLTFCESADDYPEEQIKTMLKKQPKFLLDHLYDDEIEDADVNRFPNYDPTEVQICSYSRKTIYPKKAQSKEGLFFVVNDNEYRQGVKVETCEGRDGQCTIPGSLSLGYTSRCVQKNILRTMVVLNTNSSSVEGFVTKPFEFPSCCSCVITMNSDRFGLGPALGVTPAPKAGVKGARPKIMKS